MVSDRVEISDLALENGPAFLFLDEENRQMISLSLHPPRDIDRFVPFQFSPKSRTVGVEMHLEPFDADLPSNVGDVHRRDLSSRAGREGSSRTTDSPHGTDTKDRSIRMTN